MTAARLAGVGMVRPARSGALMDTTRLLSGIQVRASALISSAVVSRLLAGPSGQESGAVRGVPTSGGPNHDAEHALGLVLRQPERLDGVLDRESVGDQSAGQLRAGSQ